MSQFTQWLKLSTPGDRFHYYKGHLAYDTRGGREAWAIWAANEAWQAYEDLKVHLVQRKLGPGCYQYIAIRAE